MAVKDPEIIDRNAKMMAEHKNILKTNFWLLRSVEQYVFKSAPLQHLQCNFLEN